MSSSANAIPDSSKRETEAPEPTVAGQLGQLIEAVDFESAPNNVVGGAFSAVGELATGLVVAATVVVALPVACTISGAKDKGVVGGMLGLTVGTTLGVLGGAVLTVGVAVKGLLTLMKGLLRTPWAIEGVLSGKDWDPLSEDWQYYDLREEAKLFLSMTDEQYLEKVAKAGGVKHAFSAYSDTIYGDANGKDTATTNATSLGDSPPALPRRRSIENTELYDILGIDSEATTAQIRRAYYVKARESHPDRNRDDPDAQVRFQKIGEAYQVLSNPEARAVYDESGSDALNSVGILDAGALYAMLFGNEKFDDLIGELKITQHMKGVIGGVKMNPQLAPFKQKKREVQCAVNLVEKLQLYIDAPFEDVFTKQQEVEVKELAQSPLGATLLGVIGSIYVEQARAELSILDAVWLSMYDAGLAVVDFFSVIGQVGSTLFSAMAVQNAVHEGRERQKKIDEDNGITEEERNMRQASQATGMQYMQLGPDATEEEKKKFCDATKAASINVLNLLWKLMHNEVKIVLKSVCHKVMHDHSVDASTRLLRAKGIYSLGLTYMKYQVEQEKGIEHLMKQVGLSMRGVYGDYEPESPESGQEETGYTEAASMELDTENMSDDERVRLLEKVDSLSIKELTLNINKWKGASLGCVEKSDLVRRLKELMIDKMSDDCVRKAVNTLYGVTEDIDVHQLDQKVLLDVLYA